MTESLNPDYELLRGKLAQIPAARIPTLEEFEGLSLRKGAGSGQEGDHCAVQVRRRWEGLDSRSYDIPETDSRVCGAFLIRFQDRISDDAIRNRLVPPLAVRLIGSGRVTAVERRRAW